MSDVAERQIVYRKLDELVPYVRNARTHSAEQLAKLSASLAEYGWTSPMLIADNSMIAGHGRLAAAIQLRDAGKRVAFHADPSLGPTIDLSHLSELQRRAYILADNRLAEDAGWDEEILRSELAALRDMGADLTMSGFDLEQLTDLLNDPPEGLTDPDLVPEEPVVPVTRPGDVWRMGKHRLVCGDSTTAAAVAAALGGASPQLMVTDPPYGVEYDAAWRDQALGGKPGGRATGKVHNDEHADWGAAWALYRGDVAYIWHDPNRSHIVAESILRSGLELRVQIIWAKSQFVIGRGHYHAQHEPCWYAVRKGSTGHWSGGHKQATLWSIDKPQASKTGHSTQKPVECMKRPIENNSAPGDHVYDPFLGSGTTLIAAEMTGRVGLGVEIHPPYVDIAVLRWQDFTGETATLEATGQTYAQLAAERLPTAALEPAA